MVLAQKVPKSLKLIMQDKNVPLIKISLKRSLTQEELLNNCRKSDIHIMKFLYEKVIQPVKLQQLIKTPYFNYKQLQ